MIATAGAESGPQIWVSERAKCIRETPWRAGEEVVMMMLAVVTHEGCASGGRVDHAGNGC